MKRSVPAALSPPAPEQAARPLREGASAISTAPLLTGSHEGPGVERADAWPSRASERLRRAGDEG